jgi:hypothetical protein
MSERWGKRWRSRTSMEISEIIELLTASTTPNNLYAIEIKPRTHVTLRIAFQLHSRRSRDKKYIAITTVIATDISVRRGERPNAQQRTVNSTLNAG